MIEPAADTVSGPLLEIDEATVLRGGNTALDRLSLRIDRGEHTAVLGRNGSGKSTLVRLIAREVHALARPESPAPVRVFGRERWRLAELRGRLGIVSPALQQQLGSERGSEVLASVESAFFAAHDTRDHLVTPAMRRQAVEALDRIGAAALAGRVLASLSTGEARRVLIARALVHRPQALLLDEPCMGLDMTARRTFLEQLRTLARDGTTLILVTHHVEEIVPEIGRVVLLHRGRIVADGPRETVLRDAPLSTAFEAAVAVSQRNGWYSAALA
ncbi:MAG: ATP-binding cassette domain-containing protein [Xanthomonadaceae bacterium]|nr:ATP-binding cassette domain-containing protein [Xanthomonadaceae bacterium]MDE1965127.1 ATP-binding cassette domain-containing protein [Xanthomonadaceae bacterium]